MTGDRCMQKQPLPSAEICKTWVTVYAIISNSSSGIINIWRVLPSKITDLWLEMHLWGQKKAKAKTT